MNRLSPEGCPAWCVADHAIDDDPGSLRHRGATQVVPAVLEGRGSDGPHPAELLVEISRAEAGETWIYLGDGWSGFSLTLESAVRLSAALTGVLSGDGTLEATGL